MKPLLFLKFHFHYCNLFFRKIRVIKLLLLLLLLQGYLIYQDVVGQVGNTSNHKFTVTSLTSMTKYTFIVKPYNSAGVGPPIDVEATTTGMV